MRAAVSGNSVDVLIVEDDADLRHDLRLLLEHEGYSCAEAENAADALDVARQSMPRLALIDWMLPGENGLATTRHLRADPRTRNIHVHMLTAGSDSAVRRAARKAGCEVVLTKPVDVQDLLDAVTLAMHS
jgi:CheY-like chemotaxis protein